MYKISELHTTVKGLILYTEEINNKANPQLLLEMRDSYDHLLRVIKHSLDSNKDKEYLIANLDKSVGHLCRAGFDTLEVNNRVPPIIECC